MAKMSDIEVREVVDSEGLDYAVRHYMDSNGIGNPETAKLWDAAAEALNALAAQLKLDS